MNVKSSFIGMSLLLLVVMGCSESRDEKYIRLKQELVEVEADRDAALDRWKNIWKDFAYARGVEFEVSSDDPQYKLYEDVKDEFIDGNSKEKREWDKWKAKQKELEGRMEKLGIQIDALEKT